MTPKQERFVLEYCKDLNATQAAIRAGYSAKTAATNIDKLLKNTEINEAITETLQTVAKRAEITVEGVLQRWWDIANANPNDLIVNAIDCCRHCYGAAHAYQWTEAEYSREVDKAIESGKPPPDGLGGFGFNPHLPPHPECPECFGDGVERISVADTRKLKGPAKLLYAGVKKTKDGIQVLMRDQDAALNMIARYLGMLVERKEISGPNGGPVPMATISASDLTDDQLASLIASDAAES